MADTAELEARFWKSLKSDMTAMLALADGRGPHPRPMTAQLREGSRSIWFFTASDTELAQRLNDGARALMTFTAKDHDLFATVHGDLSLDMDRAIIDELWNPFVAAWYEGGKDDPKLRLLRLDPDDAEIWLNGSSLVAGVKALLGIDPKKDYQKNVGEVRLN